MSKKEPHLGQFELPSRQVMELFAAEAKRALLTGSTLDIGVSVDGVYVEGRRIGPWTPDEARKRRRFDASVARLAAFRDRYASYLSPSTITKTNQCIEWAESRRDLPEIDEAIDVIEYLCQEFEHAVRADDGVSDHD